MRSASVSPTQPQRDPQRQLELFDAATARQRARELSMPATPATDRGWTREELWVPEAEGEQVG